MWIYIYIHSIHILAIAESDTNLCTDCTDYKKAYDSTPHTSTLERLELYNTNRTLRASSMTRKTSTEANSKPIAQVTIKYGIYQEDALSSLLFCRVAMNSDRQPEQRSASSSTWITSSCMQGVSETHWSTPPESTESLGIYKCHSDYTSAVGWYQRESMHELTSQWKSRTTSGSWPQTTSWKTADSRNTLMRRRKMKRIHHGRPLHRMYHQQIEKVADIKRSQQWLENAGLTDCTEARIMAAQEEALSTRSIEARVYHSKQIPRCRLCKDVPETVQHNSSRVKDAGWEA